MSLKFAFALNYCEFISLFKLKCYFLQVKQKYLAVFHHIVIKVIKINDK